VCSGLEPLLIFAFHLKHDGASLNSKIGEREEEEKRTGEKKKRGKEEMKSLHCRQLFAPFLT